MPGKEVEENEDEGFNEVETDGRGVEEEDWREEEADGEVDNVEDAVTVGADGVDAGDVEG